MEYGVADASDDRVEEPGAGTEHVVVLSNLLAGTRYKYRLLLDGGVVGQDRTFSTAPADPSAPFRFAVLADCGSGSRHQARVGSRILASDPAFVLIAGDVVYDSGAPEEIDPHYFEPYEDLVERIPFYPALGNHDVRTQGGRPLLDALYLPSNNSEGTERYYSFDYGAAHFVALDSNASVTPGSLQRQWLEADLTQSSATWKFVYFHASPYSSSAHGSSLALREALCPIFDAHHVDMVFTAHDHDYERTYPMMSEQVVQAGEEPDYTDPQGTVYVVTGGGGRSLYASGKSFFTAFSESSYHFVRVDVDGLELRLEAIREDGSPLDHMSIRKSPPPASLEPAGR